MRGALVLCLLLVVPALAVPAGAQSLAQRLGDLQFPEIDVQVSAKEINVVASRATISGATASDLRKCIDNSGCPDSSMAALSDGDGNGIVDAGEVNGFEGGLTAALNLDFGTVAEFKRTLRELVTIDGHAAGAVRFRNIDIADAEGAASQTRPIFLTIQVRIDYPDVDDRASHKVTIQREESNLELAQRIIIRPADGWRMPRDDIQPEVLRNYYQDGHLEATQAEMEGPQPMTFNLERDAGSNLLIWLAALALLAGAGILFFVWRSRQAKA